MTLEKIELKQANEFVSQHHRHHKPTVGHKFSLGAFDDGQLVGVAIVGRPVSRHLDKRGAWEVNRMCSAGKKNVCSFLYAAAAREVRRRGGRWIVTYILHSERGTSLKACGWHRTITTPGMSWNVPSRSRTTKHPLGKKVRYEKYL